MENEYIKYPIATPINHPCKLIVFCYQVPNHQGWLKTKNIRKITKTKPIVRWGAMSSPRKKLAGCLEQAYVIRNERPQVPIRIKACMEITYCRG